MVRQGLTSAVCPAVAAIFQALCDGAAANPDEDMEDDEGDFFFDQVRQQSTQIRNMLSLAAWKQLSWYCCCCNRLPQRLYDVACHLSNDKLIGSASWQIRRTK